MGGGVLTILAFRRESLLTSWYFPKVTELVLCMSLLILHYILQNLCVYTFWPVFFEMGSGVSSILAFRREALPTLWYFPEGTELALSMSLLILQYISNLCVHHEDVGGGPGSEPGKIATLQTRRVLGEMNIHGHDFFLLLFEIMTKDI